MTLDDFAAEEAIRDRMADTAEHLSAPGRKFQCDGKNWVVKSVLADEVGAPGTVFLHCRSGGQPGRPALRTFALHWLVDAIEDGEAVVGWAE